MQPTAEQQAIIDAGLESIASGSGNIAVIARAGTGKSTTLAAFFRAAAGKFPASKITNVFYNKKVRNDMLARIPELKGNVEVVTNHTIAYRMLGGEYEKAHRLLGVNDKQCKRMNASQVADILGIDDYESGDSRVSRQQIAQLAMRTVDRWAMSGDEFITWKSVPYTPALDEHMKELRPIAVKYAREIWADKRDKKRGIFPVTHDDYFRMWADLPYSRYYGACLVAVDEAQDTSVPMWNVLTHHFSSYMTKAGKSYPACPVIAVGDDLQQLYDWRGGHNIMPLLPEATQLYLTQTWRFGGEIVDVANDWLRAGGASPDSLIAGNPDKPSAIVEGMQDPGAILCRTNSGLIEAALWCAEHDRTYSLHNGGAQLRSLAEAIAKMEAGMPNDHPDLTGITDIAEFYKLVDDDPAFSDYKIVAKIIKERGARVITDLTAGARSEGDSDTHCATVHSQKGAEYSRVKVWNDMTLTPDEETGEYKIQDVCVAYVAVTRGISALDLGPLADCDV